MVKKKHSFSNNFNIPLSSVQFLTFFIFSLFRSLCGYNDVTNALSCGDVALTFFNLRNTFAPIWSTKNILSAIISIFPWPVWNFWHFWFFHFSGLYIVTVMLPMLHVTQTFWKRLPNVFQLEKYIRPNLVNKKHSYSNNFNIRMTSVQFLTLLIFSLFRSLCSALKLPVIDVT